MPARLVALDGTADIRLAGLLTLVGRERGCNVLLDSSRVSRHHCCLALSGDGVLVRDLGSTNGVSINGQRVDEGLLRPGDLLAIAHLRFRLVAQPLPAAGVPGDAPLASDARLAPSAPETVRDLMPPDHSPGDSEGTRRDPTRGL
jgi:pSer/pThr/pTyr-binding forkhead associated (FHA) protein